MIDADEVPRSNSSWNADRFQSTSTVELTVVLADALAGVEGPDGDGITVRGRAGVGGLGAGDSGPFTDTVDTVPWGRVSSLLVPAEQTVVLVATANNGTLQGTTEVDIPANTTLPFTVLLGPVAPGGGILAPGSTPFVASSAATPVLWALDVNERQAGVFTVGQEGSNLTGDVILRSPSGTAVAVGSFGIEPFRFAEELDIGTWFVEILPTSGFPGGVAIDWTQAWPLRVGAAGEVWNEPDLDRLYYHGLQTEEAVAVDVTPQGTLVVQSGWLGFDPSVGLVTRPNQDPVDAEAQATLAEWVPLTTVGTPTTSGSLTLTGNRVIAQGPSNTSAVRIANISDATMLNNHIGGQGTGITLVETYGLFANNNVSTTGFTLLRVTHTGVGALNVSNNLFRRDVSATDTDTLTVTSNTAFFNNIVDDNIHSNGRNLAGLPNRLDYNQFWGATPPAGVLDPSNIFAPYLSDSNGVSPDNAGVDQGSGVDIHPFDINGVSRPQGGAVDIGPQEQ